jgi:hypothetical protein
VLVDVDVLVDVVVYAQQSADVQIPPTHCSIGAGVLRNIPTSQLTCWKLMDPHDSACEVVAVDVDVVVLVSVDVEVLVDVVVQVSVGNVNPHGYCSAA